MFIYALLDPDTEDVRYIGRTIDLKQRLMSHVAESMAGSTNNKAIWIRGLKESGKKPLIIQVSEVDSVDANRIEREFIALYRENGANLLNMLHGGENGKRIYSDGSLDRIRQNRQDRAKYRLPDKQIRLNRRIKERRGKYSK